MLGVDQCRQVKDQRCQHMHGDSVPPDGYAGSKFGMHVGTYSWPHDLVEVVTYDSHVPLLVSLQSRCAGYQAIASGLELWLKIVQRTLRVCVVSSPAKSTE